MINLSKLDSIKDISLDALIIMGGQLRDQERELINAKNVMNAEILERLTKLKRDGRESGEYLCTVVKMVRFTKVDLSVARDLGAVKEVVDEAKLRALNAKGVKIKGKTTLEYINIKHKGGDEV